MKKLIITLFMISLVGLFGCTNKNDAKVPQSVITFQQIKLTPEQNQKVDALRKAQFTEIEKMKKEMEIQRVSLLEVDKKQNITDEQKKENFEKYKASTKAIGEKLNAQREAYDKAFMDILDDNQKKIYKKYLKQREKETKKFRKNLK